NIDTYDFKQKLRKTNSTFPRLPVPEEARSCYISLKEDEFNAEKECHDDLRSIGEGPRKKNLAEFVPVVTKTKEQITRQRKNTRRPKKQNKLR
ncbi:hypothetical protein TNCV_197671, partial [Trichonephila clavipes]